MIIVEKEIEGKYLRGYRDVLLKRLEKEKKYCDVFIKLEELLNTEKRDYYINFLLDIIYPMVKEIEERDENNIRELKYKIKPNTKKYLDYLESYIRFLQSDIERLSYTFDNSVGKTK